MPNSHDAHIEHATPNSPEWLVQSLVEMLEAGRSVKGLKYKRADAKRGRPVAPLGTYPGIAERMLEAEASRVAIEKPLRAMLAHIARLRNHRSKTVRGEEMKESEAWLILAEEHDAVRTWSSFLCSNLRAPDQAVRIIPRTTREKMASRIEDALDGKLNAYGTEVGLSNICQEARQARVLACLMFGQQAKDEERRHA